MRLFELRLHTHALRSIATAVNFEIVHTLKKKQNKSFVWRLQPSLKLTQEAKVAASCCSWLSDAGYPAHVVVDSAV
jgi:hypothetical protein